MMDPSPIMQSQNLTVKCILKNTLRIYQRVMQNNTLGGVPLITRFQPIPIESEGEDANPAKQHRSPWTTPQTTPPPTTFQATPSGARQHIVMQQGINLLAIQTKSTLVSTDHTNGNAPPHHIPGYPKWHTTMHCDATDN